MSLDQWRACEPLPVPEGTTGIPVFGHEMFPVPLDRVGPCPLLTPQFRPLWEVGLGQGHEHLYFHVIQGAGGSRLGEAMEDRVAGMVTLKIRGMGWALLNASSVGEALRTYASGYFVLGEYHVQPEVSDGGA